MSGPLAGRTIALAEGRQLEELAQLLEKEGATPLRCPMFNILDAPDPAPVLAWLDELLAGRLDLVVLMTGEGLRRLLGFADRAGKKAEIIAAFGRTRTLTRGPKPGRALKEIGLSSTVVAAEPTTEGVIATLKNEAVRGKKVGVQLYGVPNPALVESLEGAGATVRTVLPYVYAPATDAQRVADLIRRMAEGSVDAVVFTSSPQVDRLYEVATSAHLEAVLTTGLQRTRVAAIGPVVADNLRAHGREPDICPEQGFVMKNLVQHIKRALGKD